MATTAKSMARPRRDGTRSRDPREPPTEPSPPSLPPSPPGRARPRERRVLFAAFVVAGVIHVVAIALYPLLVRRDPVAADQAPDLVPSPRPTGTVIVSLVELADGAEPAATPEPPPAAAPAPPEAAPPAPAVPEAPPAAAAPPAEPEPAPAPTRSAAERLRPGDMDARLWTLHREATELTPEQVAQLRVLWAIVDMNDSTALVEAAAAGLMDWTHTDSRGRRWGISEGMLHLGNLTIPLPFQFGGPLRGDAARRARDEAEVRGGAAAAAARDNLGARIRAIRERIDRERRGQVPDTSGVR